MKSCISFAEECRQVKDTCRKSYVMRPLSGRKSWEQNLIARFQWRFLGFRIEFLQYHWFAMLFEQSVEVNIVINKGL